MPDFAILIGIKKYPDGANLEELHGPHNDLDMMTAWLTADKNAGGGGLDPDDILPLTENDTGGRTANYVDILKGVKSIKGKALAHARSQGTQHPERPWAGRLYLYFAGHGFFPPAMGPHGRMEAGFLPTDWEPEIGNIYVPVYKLALHLMQAQYFEEIVVITDACRSKFTRSLDPKSLDLTDDPDAAGGESRLMLCYAASNEESAVELQFDGAISGVFTKAFSEALVAAPRNQNDELTFRELRNFIEGRVPSLLRPTDYQNPRIEVLARGDEIVLASGPMPDLEIRIAFSNGGYDEDLVLRDAQFNEVGRISAGSAEPVMFTQPAGAYLLEGPNGHEIEILNYDLGGKDIVL